VRLSWGSEPSNLISIWKLAQKIRANIYSDDILLTADQITKLFKDKPGYGTLNEVLDSLKTK
jgi:hypothetical protein